VGIGLILLFATLVVQWLPPFAGGARYFGSRTARDSRPARRHPHSSDVPYIFRMTRVTMIDVLDSEYMEMAAL